MKTLLLYVSESIAVLNLSLGAMAQGGVTLSGVIQDPTGAVISEAKLTLANKATGESHEAMSDAAGSFAFQNTVPGDYSLRAEAKGYEVAELTITVGREPPEQVKIKLKITISEEMTITDDRPEPPTSPERNADAVKLDDALLRGLPTEGQNILPVIGNFLSPAAQGTQGTSIMVDGIESDRVGVPTAAIKRLLINRNPYSAEYRRPGKARIEVITRGGSHRHYHGSFALFARDSIFDARNPFALLKPDLARRLLEASFGGPLTKRASFFFGGERLINNGSAVVNARTLVGPFIKNVSTPQRRTSLVGRVDLNLGQVHAATARYDLNDESERNQGVGGFSLPEQGVSAKAREHRFQLSEQAISSQNFLNDFRFVFEQVNQSIGSHTEKPTVVVLGAFTGGPAQTFRVNRGTALEFQNITSYFRGSHTIRFGARVRPKFIRATDASNFGGTFEFSSLDNFATRSPFVFRIDQGRPDVSFSKHELSGFLQDEMNVRPYFRVMLGLRYDLQYNIGDRNNLAPRLSLAFAPGKQKTVLRAGAGIFYERLRETVIQQTLLFDGSRIREVVVSEPGFPNPFNTGKTNLPPPSATRVAADLSTPYLMQASIGIERELWGRTQIAAEYQTIRGVHLLRSRNINAPLSQAGPRPNPSFLNINQVESSATMRSNSLSVTYRTHIVGRLRAIAQYTLSRTTNDTSGPFSLPANNLDLRGERGRADFDRRHRFSFASVLELPFALRIGSTLALATGAPFNITTGFDDNHDTVANDRPLGITRNTGAGPGLAQLDLRLAKLFPAPRPFNYTDHHSKNLEISIDAFNALNRTNFSNFIGVRTSPFFGRANSALPARTIQLSMKYSF